MKKHVLFFSLAVVLVGCRNFSTQDDLKPFVTGEFVRFGKNEFSKVSDTLIVAQLSEKGNTYSIVRKVSYQRVRQGKLLPVERKVEKWTAVYNESEKTLHETIKGKVITFHPERNTLLVGGSEYQKLER